MKLRIGERLPNPLLPRPGSGTNGTSARAPSLYKVTGIVQETPWYGFYEGKKVFRNFNVKTGDLEEATDEECLNVFLKTLIYSRLDDKDLVKARRGHAWFEAKKCLGLRKTNLLPEPLDFLEVPNLQDDFTFNRAGSLKKREPILVLAKVHGIPLARWLLDQRPSLMRRLRVLADILGFVEVIHQQNLLLAGLSPATLWIDEMDRLCYMASEMMVEVVKPEAWRSIFPPERYPSGYSAPEVFAAQPFLDSRIDLFSWAALGYFLLIGESPVSIARAQGQRYACFQAEHFQQLGLVLQALSAREIGRVSEWFEVAGMRFARRWPDSMTSTLQQCLNPHAQERPISVGLLRNACLQSPPRPVPFAVGVRINACETILLLSIDGLEAGAEIVVRRCIDSIPRGAHDGQVVLEGPPTGRIIDKCLMLAQSLPHFTVYTLVRSDGEKIVSTATPVILLDLANPGQFRDYAEQLVDQDDPLNLLDVRQLPERLELFGRLDDLTVIGGALLGSPRPLVRRWAITLLERQTRKPGLVGKEWELLFQRGLQDARSDLREAAARALLARTRQPPRELVLQLVGSLGGANLDDQIRALDRLKSHLESGLLHSAREALEANRLISCPECHAQVRAWDRDAHLQILHKYVFVDGNLLPYGPALTRLWDLLFTNIAVPSAIHLADLFGKHPGANASVTYAQAFQAQFQNRWPAILVGLTEADRERRWQQLARCLAAHEVTRSACRALLAADDAALRYLARLALVPLVAAQLRNATAVPATFRREVELLCGKDNLDTKIAVCGQLAAAGASSLAAEACAKELELDRELPCSHCGVAVTRREKERHLRMAHDIYEFRGERRSWENTLRYLCRCLFAASPDREAAQTFLGIAVERVGEAGAIGRLATCLAEEMTARPNDTFRSLTRASAHYAVASLPIAQAVTEHLLTASLAGAAELGLGLFTALPEPPIPTLTQKVVHRLTNQAIPVEIRQDALARLLRLYRENASFGMGLMAPGLSAVRETLERANRESLQQEAERKRLESERRAEEARQESVRRQHEAAERMAKEQAEAAARHRQEELQSQRRAEEAKRESLMSEALKALREASERRAEEGRQESARRQREAAERMAKEQQAEAAARHRQEETVGRQWTASGRGQPTPPIPRPKEAATTPPASNRELSIVVAGDWYARPADRSRNWRHVATAPCRVGVSATEDYWFYVSPSVRDGHLAGLANLAGVSELVGLSCRGCERITDQTLRFIRGLTQLHQLSLQGCHRITDDGVAFLAALNGLRELTLSACVLITDEGLRHLQGLTRLKKLHLSGCTRVGFFGCLFGKKGITSDGLTALAEELPECEILW